MKIHFFLIDDDEDEPEILAEALAGVQEDCKCTCVRNAETALKILPYLEVDFIFIDINMPSINGHECVRMIKTQIPNLNARLVMYSTGLDKPEQEWALSQGADYCLRKTSTIPELSAAISTLIRQYHFA
jgi:CheY-like chemotaxis protein